MARVLAGEVPIVQKNKAWNAKVTLQRGSDTGKQLYDTRWTLLEAPPGTAFITSDNPVRLADPSVQKLGPEGFKPGNEFQFTVPVSPQFLLIGGRKRGPDSRTMVRPQDVQQANALLMERAEEVYASFQSKELQAEFDQIYKTRPPSIRKLPEEYLKESIARARRKIEPKAAAAGPATDDGQADASSR